MGHDVNEKLTGDFYTNHFAPGLSEDGDTLILNIGPAAPRHPRRAAGDRGAGRRVHPQERAGAGLHPPHARKDGRGEDLRAVPAQHGPGGLPACARLELGLRGRGGKAHGDHGAAAGRVHPRHHLRAQPHLLPPALVGGLPAGPGRLHPDPVRVCRPRADPGHPADRHRLAPDLLLLPLRRGGGRRHRRVYRARRGSSAGISPGGCPCTAIS